MRDCTVFRRAQRTEIDRALVDNETSRSVAKSFDRGASAVYRHKQHLPEHLAKAARATEQENAGALVRRLQERETIESTDARGLLTRLSEIETETPAILAEARNATSQVPCSNCGAKVVVRGDSNDTAPRAIARLENQLPLAGDILGLLQTKLSVEVRTIRSYKDLTVEELEFLIAEVEHAHKAGALNEGGANGRA